MRTRRASKGRRISRPRRVSRGQEVRGAGDVRGTSGVDCAERSERDGWIDGTEAGRPRRCRRSPPARRRSAASPGRWSRPRGVDAGWARPMTPRRAHGPGGRRNPSPALGQARRASARPGTGTPPLAATGRRRTAREPGGSSSATRRQLLAPGGTGRQGRDSHRAPERRRSRARGRVGPARPSHDASVRATTGRRPATAFRSADGSARAEHATHD